jgi:hypothetical protein
LKSIFLPPYLQRIEPQRAREEIYLPRSFTDNPSDMHPVVRISLGWEGLFEDPEFFSAASVVSYVDENSFSRTVWPNPLLAA